MNVFSIFAFREFFNISARQIDHWLFVMATLKFILEPEYSGNSGCAALARALALALLAALMLCTSSLPCIAATSLATLQKRLKQEQQKTVERKKSLSRLTAQERKLNTQLAEAEKRILELEQNIAQHQERLLATGADDDKERRHYEALLAEQAKTKNAQAETLRLLWELACTRELVGGRNTADWADTNRDYAWSKELYAALALYGEKLDRQEVKLAETLGRRDKLSHDMQQRIASINAEKTKLLQKRLEYDKNLAELRKKRDSDEAELARILKLVENLDLEINQRSEGDIASAKGRLKPPVNGTVRVRYGPQADAHSRGLGFATAEKAPVRSVATGKVVHNDVLRGFGTVLIVQHSEEYYALYAYLGSSVLKVGQEVKGGQVVGHTGYYPAIKGPGLYFELRFKQKAINPEPWFAS